MTAEELQEIQNSTRKLLVVNSGRTRGAEDEDGERRESPWKFPFQPPCWGNAHHVEGTRQVP